MYCAFLGVARPWNNVVSLGEVLEVAFTLFLIAAVAVLVALRFAARDEPEEQPDWLDSVKARLSDRMPLSSDRMPLLAGVRGVGDRPEDSPAPKPPVRRRRRRRTAGASTIVG